MADSKGAFVRKRSRATPAAQDRRTQRTRCALFEAFNALFFERAYDRITVGAIVRRAGVGRSTFYEHYIDKEDLLSASIRAPLSGLAASVDRVHDGARARRAIAHFWQNRNQARLIFGGGARAPITRVLATMIADRLRARAPDTTRRSIHLAAVAIAESHVGTVAAWLRGEVEATANDVADALVTMARVGAQIALRPRVAE
jgi:AcrR family transcriptional regulator